jgi:hypothetical protein
MTQQQTATIANATRSEVENVPEIQSLTLRVEELSRSVDFWNQLMIWGLAVAAVAAVFIVVATRIVVSRIGRLSTAQDSLREAKDRQLQLDLSQKGIEIGNLKVAAGTAETEIATAKTELAKQQERAAKAELQLETERNERVGLEGAVANRVIVNQDESGDRLKAFPGIKVVIFSRAETEQWKLAGQLSTVAYLANWQVLEMHRFSNPDPKISMKVFDKVWEIPIFTREGVDIGASNTNDLDLEVAKALQAELAKSKIKAHVSRPPMDLPPGTLLITIGENPTDYFDRNKKGTRGNVMYMNVIEHP